MPSFDQKSSRWGCSATQPLDTFYHDIVPGDVSNYHLKRKASPLLAPHRALSHDPALWHKLLHQAQSGSTKRPRADNINPYLRRASLSTTPDVRAKQPTPKEKHVTLPDILVPLHHRAIQKKGISNGTLASYSTHGKQTVSSACTDTSPFARGLRGASGATCRGQPHRCKLCCCPCC